MSQITDKELLAICNLTNLKLEFANLKTEDDVTKKLSNHTIESLLDAEYDGIEKRELLKKTKNKIRQEKAAEKYMYDAQTEIEISNFKSSGSTESTHYNGIQIEYSHADSQITDIREMEWEAKIDKQAYELTKISKDEDLGVFIRITDQKEKVYIHPNKTVLRKTAPIVLEYYDRLVETDDEFESAGQFLKQWEIMYAGDDYKIGYDRICNFFNNHKLYTWFNNLC
jgi:hypothetical protein